MSGSKKHYDIDRIVRNAELLSDPQIYENFLYECEDPDGFAEIEEEIDKLIDLLPSELCIADLPETICGNKKTRIYGKATCSYTSGHLVLKNDLPESVIFSSIEEAVGAGFRPCARCMPEAYKEWKSSHTT